MSLPEKPKVEVSVGRASATSTSDDLTMAWAVDVATNQPRYILELDAAQKGNKCNCKCPSCNLPVMAINAGKSSWKRRPHFRHPKGAARERCLLIAARRAVEAMFARQHQIVLPRRRRSRDVEGLSGQYFNAWIERPVEKISIRNCAFVDEARAILTLDDGRRLVVQLAGRGRSGDDGNSDHSLTALIEIRVDDPAVADMPPDEILSRLALSWAQGCWIRHWADEAMDAEAEAEARVKAGAALDWLEGSDLPDNLTPLERRETLLHREVKAILERERRIRVPAVHATAEWQYANGKLVTRKWSQAETELTLTSVQLEVHLGRSVPDVIASWATEDGRSHSMLIEVTVTNPLTTERIERLSSFGLPAMEIDISRMGGVVTQEEFTRLVVDEVAGKSWLYHPSIKEERDHLLVILQAEEAQYIKEGERRNAILAVPASEWASRYLDAVRRRWREQLAFGDSRPDTEGWLQAQHDIGDAIVGLVEHGYPASQLDEHVLRRLVARILSFHDNTSIDYQVDTWGIINSILCDGSEAKKWHTMYLIALKAYPPTLSAPHLRKLKAWRSEVVASIRKGEDSYVRDSTYDRLMGLLFPEMQRGLDYPLRNQQLEYHANDLLLGLFPIAHNDPDRELLLAALQAKNTGESPGEFATRYATATSEPRPDEILQRLFYRRAAWSPGRWDD